MGVGYLQSVITMTPWRARIEQFKYLKTKHRNIEKMKKLRKKKEWKVEGVMIESVSERERGRESDRERYKKVERDIDWELEKERPRVKREEIDKKRREKRETKIENETKRDQEKKERKEIRKRERRACVIRRERGLQKHGLKKVKFETLILNIKLSYNIHSIDFLRKRYRGTSSTRQRQCWCWSLACKAQCQPHLTIWWLIRIESFSF